MTSMHSLPPNYCAVIIGSTGGLGRAFHDILKQDKKCGKIYGFSRSTNPAINYFDETSIEKAVQSVSGKINLLIDATGFLSDEVTQPEKSFKSLNPDQMIKLFTLNTIGPAEIMKHFMPLMAKKDRILFATLSARVGSIGDNRLGGWHSYRASKAALNMVLKCYAIEMTRYNPHSVCTALHPGTVATPLSDPFASDRERLTPQQSAQKMLTLLDNLKAEQTGSFRDYNGAEINW